MDDGDLGHACSCTWNVFWRPLVLITMSLYPCHLKECIMGPFCVGDDLETLGEVLVDMLKPLEPWRCPYDNEYLLMWSPWLMKPLAWWRILWKFLWTHTLGGLMVLKECWRWCVGWRWYHGDGVLDEALVTTLGDLDGLKTNLKTLSNDDTMTCDDVMN